jgi:hypothetical protein
MSDAEEPCLQKEEHISQGILRLVNSQIAYHEIWRETETLFATWNAKSFGAL